MLIPPLRPPARRLASSVMARCALMRAIALLTLHVVVGADEVHGNGTATHDSDGVNAPRSLYKRGAYFVNSDCALTESTAPWLPSRLESE